MRHTSMPLRCLATCMPLLTACDAITEPNIALTEPEIAEAYVIVLELTSLALSPPMPVALRSVRSAAPDGDAAVITTHGFQRACPQGGAVTFVGTTDQDEASGNYVGDFTKSPNGCRVEGQSGRVWTLNGNPNLRTQYSYTAASDAYAGTQTGAFRYRVGSRSGTCGVNLTFTTTDGSGEINGQLCGRTVSYPIGE